MQTETQSAFIRSLWTARVTPDGTPYPASMWDTVSGSPFVWSTPAPNNDGSYPDAWRCARTDEALALFGTDSLKFYAVHDYSGRSSRIVIRSRDDRRWKLTDLLAPAGVRVRRFADRLVISDDLPQRPFERQ